MVVLAHWNSDDFLCHQVYVPCPSRNPLKFAFGWTRQTQIVRQEVAVEHVAVHTVLHLMVKHAIDDLVSDLLSTFQRQIVPATNNPKSYLAVNIATRRCCGCLVFKNNCRRIIVVVTSNLLTNNKDFPHPVSK